MAKIQEIASKYIRENVSTLSKTKEKSQPFEASKMGEYIRVINECYPEEIVRYYSPGYSATLLSKIDDYLGSSPGFQQKHDVTPPTNEAPIEESYQEASETQPENKSQSQ